MVSLVMFLKKFYRTLYTEQDFFGPFELLLKLQGFSMRCERQNRCVRIIFGAMRALLFAQYLLWANRFVLALWNASVEPEKALHYSHTFGVLSTMAVRMLVFKWYMADVERLQKYIRRQRAVSPPATGSFRKIINIAMSFQLTGLVDRLAFSSTYRQELYEMPSNVSSFGWPAELLVQRPLV
ncbi:AGAP001012-PA-like protein [Anopheles sinensis]|uniref:AGAP001012-PA-like protein n=1 Tax=Anopheles sinensis TaxID=74873 RepID=A0A084VUS3_ANOSI|nr:AGAP001012-PA-like protein [Anopheles sinensis]